MCETERMSLSFSRGRFGGVAVASALVVSLSGCQLLLNDKSGSGGTGTGTSSKASTGTSSTKASTGTSSTSSTKAATGTGTGTTGTMTSSSVTASTGTMMNTCVIAAGAMCDEASPFNCPSPKVSCGGDPRCDAYCTVISGRCTGGNKQFGANAECCALCAAVVGNTTDKSTLCCRTAGLTNGTLNDSAACTNGGPFGTLDSTPTLPCGSQGVEVCSLVEHACTGSNPPIGCTTACLQNFGNASTNSYQAGDTSQTIGGAMTFALRALAATDPTQRQTDCTEAYAIVCPSATGG